MMETTEAPKPIKKSVLDDRVEEYRADEFERMGFARESAEEMACARLRTGGYEYDVHEVRSQLKRLMMAGCSSELAVRIVL